MQVALYTFGQFIHPSEYASNDGFHSRNEAVLDFIERAPGFIARSGYASDPGPESWGQEIYPRFRQENGDDWVPATLSVWQDLSSPWRATYTGIHLEALKHGRKWFQKGDWPPYVLWWIADGHHLNWQQGVQKLEELADNGPTFSAFNFANAFDQHGERVKDANVHTA